MKTDSQLQHDVLEELKWEPQVDHSQVGVTARDGVVTLTGFVPNYAQKVAAEKAARRVLGVKAIAQEIEARPSSYDVRERIMSAFKRSSTLDANSINVTVDGGTVKLSGRVHGWNERKVAKNAAWSAPGVTPVEDEIVLA